MNSVIIRAIITRDHKVIKSTHCTDQITLLKNINML